MSTLSFKVSNSFLENSKFPTASLIECIPISSTSETSVSNSIKDAVGNFEFSKKELETLKDRVDIYSGNDNETIDFMKNGGKGVVSVASHVVGNEIYEMMELVKDNDIAKADKINDELDDLFKALFEEPSPGPIKKILSESWEDVGEPLLPVTDISTDLANKIRGFYKKIKEK